MPNSVVDVLMVERAALLAELEAHPATRKLQKIDDLLSVYGALQEPKSKVVVNVAAVAVASVGAGLVVQSKPERAAIKARILAEVDNFFDDRQGPFKTAEIFSAMTNAGLVIPGKDPRNNLSAMLSNSDEFVSTPDGWVRSGSALDPKVAGASDVGASEAPKTGGKTPDNRAPQGAMQFAERG